MSSLTTSEIALLVILSLTFLGLLMNRMPPDLVALVALLALGMSGIITADQALAGFSRPAVMTIIGLFVITATLERTGVVQWVGEHLAHLSGASEAQMVLVFMAAGAVLSLVMNNIAAGAVLLPAAVHAAQSAQIRPSKLLMPLAFSTLLGGQATLFTTANIILSGSLQSQGQRALTMLDFLPLGGIMILTGTIYMLTLGRRLLPARESLTRSALANPDLLATYRLAEHLWEVRIHPDSPLVNQALMQTAIGASFGTTVVGIWHGREAKMSVDPHEVLAANDILLVMGTEDRVHALAAQGTTIGRNGKYRTAMTDLPVQLSEIVIAPRSPAIGATLKELRFRSKFGLTAVGLWREGHSYRTDVGDFHLQAGDALLMVGPHAGIQSLAQEPGYIVFNDAPPHHHATAKAYWAVGITILVLILAALNVVPTSEAMLAGAAGMVLTGCLSTEEAYRAIEWRVVVLIAGMLPIGTALMTTGLADRIGQLLTTVLSTTGPLALIAVLYGVTVLLTQVVGGQVSALVIGPIAVNAAVSLKVNPSAVGVAVAMACSVAFLTPTAHPVNILMMGPGGYQATDFTRTGLGLVVVCFVTLLLAMPLLWTLSF